MRSLTDDFEIQNGVLTVYDGVTELPDALFAGREDIESVYLPDSLRIFGMELFAECPNVKSVRLPSALRDISPAAFAECPALCEITIPDTVVSVGEGAFLNCTSLRSVTLPRSLREICDMAFWGAGLESVSVPESVKRIGESAFWSCEALKKAEVMGRGTRIGENAFGSCYGLIEGYIAPGYPEESDAPSELLYTLLWCSCPDRHAPEVSRRAERFIRANEELILERIFKAKNIPALTGLTGRGLLSPAGIEKYVRLSAEAGETELTALLLKAQGEKRTFDEEFAL